MNNLNQKGLANDEWEYIESDEELAAIEKRIEREFFERGYEQGLKRGIKQRKIKAALELLKLNVPIELIVEATGLGRENFKP